MSFTEMNLMEEARSRRTSPQRQLEIARHPDWKARWRLAANPNVTPEAQLILANDKIQAVIEYLKRNPNLTQEARLALEKRK